MDLRSAATATRSATTSPRPPACSRSTGDARFAERVDYIVAELAECQAKTGGWLTAFPGWRRAAHRQPRGQGLRRACPGTPRTRCWPACATRICIAASKPALDVLVKFADWIDRATRRRVRRPLPEDARPRTRRHERGAAPTCSRSPGHALPRRWRTASRTVRCSSRWPTATTRSTACTRTRRSPRSSASAASPTLSGDRAVSRRAPRDFFWETVVKERSFATGGHGDVEHFFPTHEFAKHLRLRQDHGDLLHAQHAAAHALAVRARSARRSTSTTSSARSSTASWPRRIPQTA